MKHKGLVAKTKVEHKRARKKFRLVSRRKTRRKELKGGEQAQDERAARWCGGRGGGGLQSGFWRCFMVIIWVEKREAAVVGGRRKCVYAAPSVVGCTQSALQHKHLPLMNNPLPNNKGVASLKPRPGKLARRTFTTQICCTRWLCGVEMRARDPSVWFQKRRCGEVGHQDRRRRLCSLCFFSSSLLSATCNKWMCAMCKMKKDVAPPVYTRHTSECLCSGAGKDGADFTPTRVVFNFPDANNNLASSPNCNIDRKHPLFLVLETSNGWLPLVCTTIWNTVLSSQPPWKHSFTLFFFFKENNNIDQRMEFLWNSTTNSPSVVTVFIFWETIFQSPQLIS